MRRRSFLTFLGAAVVWPRAVTAQSPSKVYRVGSLITGAPIADNSLLGVALIRGLAQHGYALDKKFDVRAPWRRDADGPFAAPR